MARPALTDAQVLSKINKTGPIPAHMPHAGPCWLWTGAVQPSNGGLYGRFSRNGKPVRAYWWTYERARGLVEAGKTLDHLCRNTLCVNPDHLEPVTMRVNILRGANTAAHFAARTHCNNGHEFTPENTRITKAGARLCRTCRRVTSHLEKAKARVGRPDRSHASKTQCKRGHPFDAANTHINPNGSRKCRACDRLRHLVSYKPG